MSILQFETLLADGVINLPDNISNQLSDGSVVRVSIELLAHPSRLVARDEAWNAFLKFIDEHNISASVAAPYQWQREDAYNHLGTTDDPKGTH